MTCKRRVDKRRTSDHFKSKTHLRKLKGALVSLSSPEKAELEVVESVPETVAAEEDAISFLSPMTGTTLTLASLISVSTSQKKHPPRSRLQQLFSDVGEPCLGALMNSFSDQTTMKLHHVAECTKRHGGIQCLVSRMFQKTDMLFQEQIASEKESIWHFQSFAQCTSSSDKQRRRQAEITKSLVNAIVDNKSSLFQRTRVLEHKELNRHCGNSNQHTVWNILPVPKVQNIGGIACVNPLNVMRHMLAFGTKVDDNSHVNLPENTPDDSTLVRDVVVSHIHQSRACANWERTVQSRRKFHCRATGVPFWCGFRIFEMASAQMEPNRTGSQQICGR